MFRTSDQYAHGRVGLIEDTILLHSNDIFEQHENPQKTKPSLVKINPWLCLQHLCTQMLCMVQTVTELYSALASEEHNLWGRGGANALLEVQLQALRSSFIGTALVYEKQQVSINTPLYPRAAE